MATRRRRASSRKKDMPSKKKKKQSAKQKNFSKVTSGTKIKKVKNAEGVKIADVDSLDSISLAKPKLSSYSGIDRTSVGNVSDMGYQNVGDANLIDGVNVNSGRSDQMRGEQTFLINDIKKQLTGESPSLAQLQLEAATDRNLDSNLSLARSQDGVNSALALRQAGRNNALVNQEAARQAAILRLQEQAQARSQLADVTGQARSQDIGQEQFQANIDQQTNTNNANIQNQFQLNQAELNQRTDVANQNKNLGLVQTQANIDANRAVNQAQQETQNNQFNSGLQADQDYRENTLNTQRDIQNQATDRQTAIAQSELDARNNQFNASSWNDAASRNAQMATGVQTAGIGAQATTTAAGIGAQASMSNTAANNASREYLAHLGYATQIPQTDVQNNAAYQTAQQQAHNQNSNFAGGVIGAAGTAGAAAVSDKNEKKNIEKVDHEQIKSFLNALENYKYNYKSPEKPGQDDEEHVSVMAQDLEKSELGKPMVEQTPFGKQVDYQRGLATMLSSLVSINERLKELEKK